MSSSPHRFLRFLGMLFERTALFKIIIIFIFLWLAFSGALLISERGAKGTTIHNFGDALYWGVAAFSTAGVADVPAAPLSRLIGGVWIVVGSILFFGTIVSVVTAYFLKPLQRPRHKIVDTIVTGLEQLDELTPAEQQLLEAEIACLFKEIKRQREGVNEEESVDSGGQSTQN